MLTATRIAAVVAALALSTTFLGVQVGGPDEAVVPAAPTGETWVTVTGTQTISGGGGAVNGRNLDMSDPRLEGAVSITYEEDSGAEGRPATLWSTVTVTIDEGSWQGQSIGFVDEQGSHRHMGWFEGDGAYEGMAFIEQLTEANPSVPIAGVRLDVVGLLYEGELPPMVLPAPAPATD